MKWLITTAMYLCDLNFTKSYWVLSPANDFSAGIMQHLINEQITKTDGD